MKYIKPLNVSDLPNDHYLNYDPNNNQVIPAKVPGEAIEHPMREIVAAITAAGLTPNQNNLTQLTDACAIITGQVMEYIVNEVVNYPINDGLPYSIIQK